MSFLHLMQWHSEWVRRLDRWEREGAENGGATGGRATCRRRKRIPFIVVANKLDLLEGNGTAPRRSQPSTRRSVMGFRGGEYKGRELRYEYAAEDAGPDPCDRGRMSDRRPRRRPDRPLTYSLKETSWYADASYLHALRLTEDRLGADRLMILLWCRRNGIPHVEASALDGRGVDEAMERLIRMGVEEIELREREKSERMSDGRTAAMISRETRINRKENSRLESEVPSAPGSVHAQRAPHANIVRPNFGDHGTVNGDTVNGDTVNGDIVDGVATDPSKHYFVYQPRRDEELDLFARYSRTDERRCLPLGCWLPTFSWCSR